MAPFAYLYSVPKFVHARAAKCFAVANINGLEVIHDPSFNYPDTTKSPEFLTKFPMGKIPTLETPEGFCLAEGTAIAHYLADSGPKREQLLGRTTEERGLVQMWIGWSDSEVWPTASAIIGPMLGRYAYDAAYVEKQEAGLTRALKRLELHLEGGRKWLVREDEFSLADVSVASSLYWPYMFILDKEARENYPQMTEWYLRLMEVEEVKKAFEGKIVLCEKRGPPTPEGGKILGL